MAENLIPQVAQMLGVELGEEFKIAGYRGVFYFADNCLMYESVKNYISVENYINERVNYILADLLNGDCELTKLPWKPKIGEKYYSFDSKFIGDKSILIIVDTIWNGIEYDVAMLDKGWIYRTREEAQAFYLMWQTF